MEVTLKIDENELQSLFIGAFEGGSSYWAEVRQDTPKKGKDEGLAPSERWWKHIMEDGGSMRVYDNEDPDDKGAVLTKEGVQKGLQLMATEHPRHFSDFKNDNMDAITSDVWFQLALFGDIFYG